MGQEVMGPSARPDCFCPTWGSVGSKTRVQSSGPDALSARLEELGKILEQDERVLFSYLFGSLARGRSTPLSDVDLAVYLADGVDPAVTKLDLLGLACDTLGTEEMDLVVLNKASLSLALRIVRDRRVLSERDRCLRARFESLTLRKGWDFEVKERAILERRYGLGHR